MRPNTRMVLDVSKGGPWMASPVRTVVGNLGEKAAWVSLTLTNSVSMGRTAFVPCTEREMHDLRRVATHTYSYAYIPGRGPGFLAGVFWSTEYLEGEWESMLFDATPWQNHPLVD